MPYVTHTLGAYGVVISLATDLDPMPMLPCEKPADLSMFANSITTAYS